MWDSVQRTYIPNFRVLALKLTDFSNYLRSECVTERVSNPTCIAAPLGFQPSAQLKKIDERLISFGHLNHLRYSRITSFHLFCLIITGTHKLDGQCRNFEMSRKKSLIPLLSFTLMEVKTILYILNKQKNTEHKNLNKI